MFRIDLLKNNSQAAKDVCAKLEYVPWAITQMIKLYDEQIQLSLHTKQTIEGLKSTEVYKWENGEAQVSFPVHEYSRILEAVHTTGKMFERLPATYIGKGEEALRDHILVTLEALVSGSATGETFNKSGKTDILVRNGSTNEFIGECKFWHGKSGFLDTISQLLGYLSWRDTNAALIIFVPNVDFSTVLSKMQEYVSEHSNYLRSTGQKDETWHNYEFRMQEDQSRVVNVAVMLYHICES